MKKLLTLFSLFSITTLFSNAISAAPWIIAIDPGHGGKDPGAISRKLNIYEKNVTISIARELKALLDRDPNFRAVLTRKSDYYISVPERSEIARKNKANYLISIHADSSESSDMRGASVWVLSNRRASDEMGQWLEDHEKQSELLGGAGKVLASHNEKYLNQTVLDLQFAHSQRSGYELGDTVLRHFSRIANLSRSKPQHASLGVLRSPDIPSILVETGFLSNQDEELKLNTPAYRRKIAQAIYSGLVEYRRVYGSKESPLPAMPVKTAQQDKTEKEDTKATVSDSKGKEDKSLVQADKNTVKASGKSHTVQNGESLLGLAIKYKVKSEDLITLNKLKSQNLFIGQTLKIPQSEKNPNNQAETKKEDKSALNTNKKAEKVENKKSDKKAGKTGNNADSPKTLPKYHIIEQDQTLYAVSRLYGISPDKLLKINNLKDGKVRTGQKIKLQE